MNSDVNDEFQQLSIKYKGSLPQKIDNIVSLHSILTENFNQSTFYDFVSSIHKLHGSSGIYGFTELSRITGEIDRLLSALDGELSPDPEVMLKIKGLMLNLSEVNLDIIDEHIILKEIDKTAIYMYLGGGSSKMHSEFNNPQKMKILTDVLDLHGYKTTVFNNIDSLFAKINKTLPIVLFVNLESLLDVAYINIHDNEFRNMIKFYFSNCHTIFISKTGDFESRLNAIRLGGSNYIIDNISNEAIIAEIDQVKFVLDGQYKAIIVDDDLDALEHTKNILNSANINVRTLTGDFDINNELAEFKPDIILLDINMPNFSGTELAKVIRQQNCYDDLPIIYLSAESSMSTKVNAMSVGADEFLSKSTDPNQIVQAVRNKASRYLKLKSLLTKNYMTGAFNQRYILQELDRHILNYTNNGTNFTLSIIGIDNLSMIKDSYGNSNSILLMAGLYKFLYSNLDTSDIIGDYKSNMFLVISPQHTSNEIDEKLKSLQAQFRSKLQHANGKAYAVNFSYGLATCFTGASSNCILSAALEDKHNNNVTTTT